MFLYVWLVMCESWPCDIWDFSFNFLREAAFWKENCSALGADLSVLLAVPQPSSVMLIKTI